jgi:hypothetical protein
VLQSSMLVSVSGICPLPIYSSSIFDFLFWSEYPHRRGCLRTPLDSVGLVCMIFNGLSSDLLSVCGQRVRGCCDRIDSGTCKADSAGEFWAALCPPLTEPIPRHDEFPSLVNALFPISCIPAFMALRSVASWLLPAGFNVFARDPGKLTMPCLIVTKDHALRGSTFSSAA